MSSFQIRNIEPDIHVHKIFVKNLILYLFVKKSNFLFIINLKRHSYKQRGYKTRDVAYGRTSSELTFRINMGH